jgi:hypothetical protein
MNVSLMLCVIQCYQMEEGGGGQWWEATVIEDEVLQKAPGIAAGSSNPQNAGSTGQQQQQQGDGAKGVSHPGPGTQHGQLLNKAEAGGVKNALPALQQQAVQWPVRYGDEGLWERYLVRWVDEQEGAVDGGG